MSDISARHDDIVTEHHGVVQELLASLRTHNSALEQAKAIADAETSARQEAEQKRDELLTYIEEMTKLIRNERGALQS